MTSRLIKLVSISVALLFIQACSHPIEIEGQGDVTSTGSRGCSFEESKVVPKLDKCAKNLVVGDYLETYYATAKPGWKFKGWVNYCKDVIAPPYSCSFNIPAATVQKYWGQTMPPLRAVFLKDGAPVYSILNDTGITFGGNYPSGNNAGCTGATIAQQDCSHGRDATHKDNADGHAGFSYTKLSSSGAALPASATSWACVRDNVTGLVWENKTDDGGIHDKDNTYRWGGKTVQGSGYGTYYPEWNALVDGSNNAALCGYTDWRVPTYFELTGLVNQNRSFVAIDTGYFPNTVASYFWSASPSNFFDAWVVYFERGDSSMHNRANHNGVRLVRSGQ